MSKFLKVFNIVFSLSDEELDAVLAYLISEFHWIEYE